MVFLTHARTEVAGKAFVNAKGLKVMRYISKHPQL